MKIAFVIGTKAELIKCMPLMIELNRQKRDYWFIHTGQHSLGKFCEEFEIKKPDFILSKEPKTGTKLYSNKGFKSWRWYLGMIIKIRKILKKIKPKYVIYHGDTISTAAASIAASLILNPFKKWKTVHLEAGLRSGSWLEPFPEEIVRQTADKLSDILLTVSKRSTNNLKRERIFFVFGKIFCVGNTVLDSAEINYKKITRAYKLPGQDYALVNVHRHENLKSKKRMKKAVDIIKSAKIKIIWPLHEVTKNVLNKYGLMKEINKQKNIEIRDLCDPKEFIFLLANCKYLIVDGGGIQEESLIFKKPCLLLRKKTERQEGLSTGINFLTKLDVEYSRKIMEKIENNKLKIKNFKNPYGKPGLSRKIIEILK